MDLKEYRKLKGLRLEDVAEALGFAGASAVAKHEKGMTMPSAEAIQKYAEFTKGAVTADDFVAAVVARRRKEALETDTA